MNRRLLHLSDSMGWALLAAGVALVAAWAAQGLWQLALPPAAWRAVGGGWFAAFVLGAEVERLAGGGRRGRDLAITAGAHLAACLLLAWWLHRQPWGLGNFPAGRAAMLLGLILLGLRGWLRSAFARGAQRGAECLRLLLLLGVAALPSWPFFTADYAGGLDARWYAYVLQDYLQQLHAGVFPVLVGQGPFAFNGAVHPFRFAPYYLNFAGLLDWASARALGVFALQHATVIVSTMAAAGTAYASLLALVPTRRWAAGLVAAAYVLGPAFWGLVSMEDAYMSFLVLPWLPLLLYGVVRAVERRDAPGHVLVAAVLAILWTTHPPVALWATIAAMAMLGLAWLGSGAQWRGAFALAGTVALFIGLSAGYLQGVLELLPHGGEPPPSPGYVFWLAAWAVLWAVIFLFWRRCGKAGPETAANATRWLILAGLGGLAVLSGARVWWPPTPHQAIVDTLAVVRNLWPGLLLPVSPRVECVTDVQPGYALLLLGGLAVAVVWPARRLPLVLLAAAALMFALLLLPVPAVTRFLWSDMPMSIVTTTSVAVSIRLVPVWAAVLAFAGFLAVAWLAEGHPRAYKVAQGVLAAAVVWSGVEVQKPARLTRRLVHSDAESADILRPENAQLFIYSYNFIGTPPDFSFGVIDYRLASRLYDPPTGRIDPDLAVHTNPPPATDIALTWEYDSRQPSVLSLSPPLVLEPGRRMRARFTFAAPEPRGTLAIFGPHFYREYLLPSSGTDRSFGAGPTNSRDLVLWNTGSEPEPVRLLFYAGTPPPPAAGRQLFARVAWGRLPDDALPVRTEALVPDYRATVEAKEPALLETPRIFIPGYVAWRNGRPAAVLQSPTNRVAVLLAPGPNEIEIRFVGSPGLHRALWVSFVCWAGVLFWGGARIMRTRRI
ncbi:MAG TPA: hypothetical protein VLW52_07365 [Opitutaceae bacterium]|nr:hypothetical protein [Opitutaceae bacterium]